MHTTSLHSYCARLLWSTPWSPMRAAHTEGCRAKCLAPKRFGDGVRCGTPRAAQGEWHCVIRHVWGRFGGEPLAANSKCPTLKQAGPHPLIPLTTRVSEWGPPHSCTAVRVCPNPTIGAGKFSEGTSCFGTTPAQSRSLEHASSESKPFSDQLGL